MTRPDLSTISGSPEAFRNALVIPTGRGRMLFAEIVAPFQRERFASLDPALIALAGGETPPITRHFWEGTKGSSKDGDLSIAVLWLICFCLRPILIVVGAADQEQADELRRAARAIVNANPWLQEIVAVQAASIINRRTGSVCEIVAADVAGSHGGRPDFLILNELSHIGRWEFAENLMDNASKVPHGLVVIATNAGHLDTPAWQWRELARTSARWAFHKFDQPAPWLDAAELEEAKRRNPLSRFLRLWHGVWSSREGDVAVSDDDLKAAVTITTGPMRRDEIDTTQHSFAGCLDLGWRHDRAAFAVLCCEHQRGRVRVAFAQDWSAIAGRDIDLTDVLRVVIEQAQHFNFGTVVGDEAQAILMGQLLAQRGIRFVGVPQAGKEATARAMGFVNAFKERLLDIYDHPALIRDLSKLRVVEKAGGVKLDAPRDESGHADLAFAVSFLLPAAIENCRRPIMRAVPDLETEFAGPPGEYVGRGNGGFHIAASDQHFNAF